MDHKKKTGHAGEHHLVVDSPLGLIEIVARGGALRQLHFLGKRSRPEPGKSLPPIVHECRRQLEEYFSGKRRRFDLDLRPQGTEFERDVWKQLLKIPYGRTASYKEIAAAIGRPQAARAVGAANGKNPLVIIVPCHRVIGRDGSLTGFGSGLWRKKWLLDHEARHA